MIRQYRVALIIFVLTLILGLVIGLQLPAEARIPTHWNIDGEVDSYVGKTAGMILLPGITLLLLLFFMFFPRISPRYRRQEERFKKILPLMANIMVLMFGCLHLLSLMIASRADFDGTELLWVILGIMFMLLGNLFPKLPSSFFIGIRTPWTLSSEVVWRKTHRVGGLAFVIGGILFVLMGVTGSVFGLSRMFFYIMIGIMVIYPLLYSYLAYQKEIRGNKEA
jgi:uncharacterized membrane protein